jgi:hypothetical protein
MAEFLQRIAQDKIAQTWTPETRAIYQDFYQHLTQRTPLDIKIGKGGLSFYKANGPQKVFVCHFNAEPRKGQHDIGFADFRYAGLSNLLDVKGAIQAIQANASSEVEIKVHTLWCSLHFPIGLGRHVAQLFLDHIIAKI